MEAVFLRGRLTDKHTVVCESQVFGFTAENFSYFGTSHFAVLQINDKSVFVHADTKTCIQQFAFSFFGVLNLKFHINFAE